MRSRRAEWLVQTSPGGRPAGSSPLAAGCRGYKSDQEVAARWMVLCTDATNALLTVKDGTVQVLQTVLPVANGCLTKQAVHGYGCKVMSALKVAICLYLLQTISECWR